MTGLSAISVQVVADATGRPVKGASVIAIVIAEQATYTKSALTDRNGRALLLGLAKGRVRLSVTHQGYLNAIHGQERAGDAGTFMPLGGEQTIGPITIRMKRGATISGVVTSESGDPLVGVRVEAFRRGFSNGRSRFLAAGSDVTDDRGAYRIAGLQPGDYLTGMVPRYLDGTHGDDAIWDPNDADSGVEFSSRLAFEPMLVLPGGRSVALDDAAPLPGETSADGVYTGYAATFYPGTTAAAAVPIKVGAGEQREGVSFPVATVPVVRISGLATVNGTTVQNGRALLSPVSSEPLNDPDQFGSQLSASGDFSFPFVPRGQYRLDIRAQTGAGGDVTISAGTATITVGDQPIRDLLVTMHTGSRLSGRLSFSSDYVESAVRALSDVRVNLSLQPSFLGSLSIGATPQPETGFAFERLAPGAYTLSVSNLPSGWFASSAMVNGRDAFDFGLRIEPGQDVENVVVTVTNRMAELTGVLRDAGGTPSSSGYVVVFPADRTYWTGNSRRVLATRPDTDGRYAFQRTLPAGDYLLAIGDLEPGSWQDPTVLASLEARAIRVRLRGDEKVVRDLRR